MFTVGTLQRHDPLRKERGVKQLLQVEKSSEKGKCNLTPLPDGAISSRKGIKAIPEPFEFWGIAMPFNAPRPKGIIQEKITKLLQRKVKRNGLQVQV